MRCLIFCCLILLANGVCLRIQAQEDTLHTGDQMDKQTDITDVLRNIFNVKPKEKSENGASVAILPVRGYNPSFGFNIGVNVMAGKQFGLKSNTIYSIFNLSFSYSTKQVVPLRARHNMFTPGNKWNWQGDWQFSKMGIVDYGIGTGQSKNIKEKFSFYDIPLKNIDSAFPIKYSYIK